MSVKKKLNILNQDRFLIAFLFIIAILVNQYYANRGVFPLDSFIPHPVQRMEVDGKPDEINEVQEELINTVKKVSGDNWVVGSIERQKFYVEAKKTMAVITTSETRPYGCFIFTKGVLKPDGTVWII